MDIHVTFGLLLFILVLMLKDIGVITKGVALVLSLISIGLQICGI